MAQPRTPAREGGDGAQPSGCLVRLVWMWAGNAALVILALTILREPPWTLTVKDALFWGVVAATVYSRYLDVTRLGGRTAQGTEPATRRHLVRHAAALVGVSALAWVFAQSIHT